MSSSSHPSAHSATEYCRESRPKVGYATNQQTSIASHQNSTPPTTPCSSLSSSVQQQNDLCPSVSASQPAEQQPSSHSSMSMITRLSGVLINTAAAAVNTIAAGSSFSSPNQQRHSSQDSIGQSTGHQQIGPTTGVPSSNAENPEDVEKYLATGGDALSLSDSGDEKSPMVCLMESCVNCRQSLQSARGDVQRLQAEMLRLAGRVRDQQYREDAKNLSVRLVERLDLLQVIMYRHLIGSETLATEERAQRRALEKSLRGIAKRNYRMKLRLQKLQWLLTEEEKPKALGTSVHGTINKPEPSSVQGDQRPKSQLMDEDQSGLVEEMEAVEFKVPDLGCLVDVDQTVASSGVSQQQQVERKRRIVSSILAGGFSSDDEGEQESSESGDEMLSVGRSSRRMEEEGKDLDEFFDVEESGTTGLDTATADLPTCVTSEAVSESSSVLETQIVRRTELPKPRTEFKVSLWSILKDCIGRDLSTISMPVYFNEPTSFLQRLAEDFQYASLLKEASRHSSPIDRLLWVVVFTISPYSSTIGRTYKPFNPLLGETFEFSHRGFRFLAEQVGHHPPVTAYHASATEFEAYGHLAVKNRFTGKSLEVTVPGVANILLNLNPVEKPAFVDYKDDSNVAREYITFQRARAIVNNVIFGKLTLEMFGQIVVTSHSCGTCAYIEYLRQGWWSREMHVVRGLIFDPEGCPRLRVGGWWNRELWVETLKHHNNPGVSQLIPAVDVLPSEDEHLMMTGSSSSPNEFRPNPTTDSFVVANGDAETAEEGDGKQENNESDVSESNGPRYYSRNLAEFKINWDGIVAIPGTRRVLWRPEPRPPNSCRFYDFGQLAMELNDLSADYDVSKGAAMPPTDSRYRPDQRWLEIGETEKANQEKTRMEEKQRAVARLRLRGEEDYNPRWFVKSFNGKKQSWVFTGEYWNAKEKNHFANCMDIF